ncbi:MAG: transketolase [Phycisphaerae bacterium]
MMSIAAAVHEKAITLARLSVRMTAKAGSGHPSSALSLAHIVVHLMYRQMHFDPADPWNPAGDRLVLSEGHAVPIIYAAYADLGGVVSVNGVRRRLRISDVDGLRTRASVLDGHPNPAEGFPFFDAATGSLGQGLSVAAGLGLAARRDGTGRRVYCLIGDGESREGQVWEAVDFIADHQLTNVCPIFNCNGQGQAAAVSHQQSVELVAAKLEAFGWNVAIINGHDPLEIERAFSEFNESDQRPVAIVAKTVKGWGVEALLHGNWHGKPLKEDQLADAGKSLEKQFAALVADRAKVEKLVGPSIPAQAKTPTRPEVEGIQWPSFEEAVRGAGLGKSLDQGKLATRRAYGVALKVAGDLLPQVIALDGDVSNSTFSSVFAKAHADRFVECKIAEQNMVSVAVGLSAAGYIPFVNTFAKFLVRAYDQIEMANISRANVKLVGSHAGISLAADGPSQMGLLDVAYFRAFTTVSGGNRTRPLCWVFHPADGVAAYHCTRLMTELRGMCYMRTHRPDVPLLYDPGTPFEPGGFHVLHAGDDLALVAAGYAVHEANAAAKLLAKRRVRATLIDAYSLPLNAERLVETLQRSGGQALVVEDNYGGLGGAVAEIAAAAGDLRVTTLCCQRIPKSALTPADALDYCGVGATQIAEQAMRMLRLSR